MSSKAKYLTIKSELIAEINEGKYTPGQKFYSESELKLKYGVSSATVIKAIHELVNEGFLFRQQGKGTFVSKAKRNKNVLISESDFNIKLNSSQVSLISVSVASTPSINVILNQLNQQEFYKIVRLKSEQRTPYAVQTSYIAEKYLNPQKLIAGGGDISLYEHLAEFNNIDMYAMPFTEEITVINCPDDDIASHLSIPKNSAVVRILRTTRMPSGDVIEYIETFKRIESFYLKLESTRGG
ncbi:GntR family transcriptional regulator [Aeromonas enteropelogenes]|uniref:GntR family transcriptional regulator n=1 Tax=Aeromonas TaxID=642 RepID=UPI0020B4189E|nr:GntR family transcriptional regulator [Aeromonas sp. FDAARGOS 1407]